MSEVIPSICEICLNVVLLFAVGDRRTVHFAIFVMLYRNFRLVHIVVRKEKQVKIVIFCFFFQLRLSVCQRVEIV